MTVHEFELVVHNAFGGFSVDTEMALWLQERRGWQILPAAVAEDGPLTTLYETQVSDWFSSPYLNAIAFRAHPDLIACVRALQELRRDLSWLEQRRDYIMGLHIVKIQVRAEIENYNDGKERVRCWAAEL